MNFRQPARFLLLTLVFLLPAITYLGIHSYTRRQQQAAVEKARRTRFAWEKYVIGAFGARYGFAVGRPFPPLPAVPPTSPVAVIGRGGPTVVIMTSSAFSWRDYRPWRELLDRIPGLTLLVATEDTPETFALYAAPLRHPRIHWLRLPRGYLDRLSIYGSPVLYSLDGRGVIRSIRVFRHWETETKKLKLSTLTSLVAGS